MATKSRKILNHKRSGKSAPLGALAQHSSLKGGKVLSGSGKIVSPAQGFMNHLRQEIKKAV